MLWNPPGWNRGSSSGKLRITEGRSTHEFEMTRLCSISWKGLLVKARTWFDESILGNVAEVSRAVPLWFDIVPISPRSSVPNSGSEDRCQYSSEGNCWASVVPTGHRHRGLCAGSSHNSEAGRTDEVQVTRKLSRTVTFFRRSLTEGTESAVLRGRQLTASGIGEIEQHAKVETLPGLKIYFRLAAATDSALDDTSSESLVGPTWSLWECGSPKVAISGVRIATSFGPTVRLVYTFKRPARVRKKALNGRPTLPTAT
ncbi:hypothetical protein EDB85DRAFT_1893729 [Lactarius pseudohatsudake]|nr:hypothetical protein EDB85DRAFT_1893729 [Lactarius pseudohatsudake]